ncbi:MAG: hypothetical protein GWO88_00110 [Planctomycetia bacterium]|nr:hypothetical protein [Planctomycetia bacterium]
MKNRLFISIAILTASAIASAETLPMPPSFKAETNAMEILEQYPLGVITEYAAGIHHGKADETLSLPNGLTGWKFVVGGMLVEKEFVTPSGEKQTITQTIKEHITKTYILVFSNGKVVDVLYHDEDRKNHITALLAQVLKNKSM